MASLQWSRNRRRARVVHGHTGRPLTMWMSPKQAKISKRRIEARNR